MKLIFLGSGSAFATPGNYQSNMLLQAKSGKTLLLDCGTDIRFSLLEQGFTHRDIQGVYVSHLHADHVGGLEWLAFSSKFDAECKKPNLYAAKDVLAHLWDKTLSGGLESLGGVNADITNYFQIHPIESNCFFSWHNVQFHLVQTLHAISGYAIMPTYGLLFTIDGYTVYLTTDSQLIPCYFDGIYKKADIIFHDCETSVLKSGLHAHYDQLKELPSDIKSKIWLYHYNTESIPQAKKDGFAGFVKKGQTFDFSR